GEAATTDLGRSSYPIRSNRCAADVPPRRRMATIDWKGEACTESADDGAWPDCRGGPHAAAQIFPAESPNPSAGLAPRARAELNGDRHLGVTRLHVSPRTHAPSSPSRAARGDEMSQLHARVTVWLRVDSATRSS